MTADSEKLVIAGIGLSLLSLGYVFSSLVAGGQAGFATFATSIVGFCSVYLGHDLMTGMTQRKLEQGPPEENSGQ